MYCDSKTATRIFFVEKLHDYDYTGTSLNGIRPPVKRVDSVFGITG